MKILLLNDNPVVNKLVTLSAQKTSDDLEVVASIDEIESSEYDLLVIDDTIYTDELFEEIKNKINFTKSLYICARDAEVNEHFSSVLKKPFLPTDLVEIFVVLGREANNIDLDTADNSSSNDDELGEIEELGGLDDISLDDDLGTLDDDISLDDELGTLDDDISLDNELGTLDDDISLDDDLGTLDDEISLDDELGTLDDDISLDDDLDQESVLDNEEAQKVKDLLEETEEETTDLEDLDIDNPLGDTTNDEISFDETEDLDDTLALEDDISEDLDDTLALEDDISEDLDDTLALEDDISEDLDDTLALEDDISEDLDDTLALEDDISEENTTIDEIPPEVDDLDLETQIDNAVEDLTQEELESEVDEETLLNIVSGDIDNLTSRDLKIAIGEEVEDIEDEKEIIDNEIEEIDNTENINNINNDEIEETQNDGVTQLENLLKALSDKNVAASMKGMKITINITLGDQ